MYKTDKYYEKKKKKTKTNTKKRNKTENYKQEHFQGCHSEIPINNYAK